MCGRRSQALGAPGNNGNIRLCMLHYVIVSDAIYLSKLIFFFRFTNRV